VRYSEVSVPTVKTITAMFAFKMAEPYIPFHGSRPVSSLRVLLTETSTVLLLSFSVALFDVEICVHGICSVLSSLYCSDFITFSIKELFYNIFK
jgi:hypothetical protein